MSNTILEVECKLTCEDGFVLEDLLQALRAVASVSEPRVVAQGDHYYDSEGQSLAKAGLSARCRHTENGHGHRSVQIKPVLLIPELTFVRPEIAGSVPDAADPGEVIRDLFKAELGLVMQDRPVAQVCIKTRREIYEVTTPECRAELCYDEATAQLPGVDGGKRFREIELELVEGRRDAFQRLVETITATPNLAASTQSKYVRARALLDLPPQRFGGPKIKFKRGDSADKVARKIGAAHLKAILAYEPGTRVGLDPEHLHKMRVATRRLRATMATFRRCFDPERADRLRADFKWLTEVLGRVRDLDVHLLDLQTWRANALAVEEPGWDRLDEVLQQRRQVARKQMLLEFDSQRYADLLELATEEFRKPRAPATGPRIGQLAAKAIGKRSRRLAAEVENRPAHCDPATVHRLRILGKKLRYTGEFFAGIAGKRFAKRIRRLTRLQDELGRFQDCIVAGELARELGEAALQGAEPAAYVSVLGQLRGRSIATVAATQQRLDHLLAHIGLPKLLDDLLEDARRLKRSSR